VTGKTIAIWENDATAALVASQFANFLFLAALMLLLAAQKFLGREYVFAAAFAALAVAMTVVHFIRVRRFKSYDEAQKMRNFD
jgi:hypothetical protein